MAIEYNVIDNTERLAIADLLSKKEAVDGELEIVQNERAVAQIGWAAKEESLKAEKNKIIAEMRMIRKATVTEEA